MEPRTDPSQPPGLAGRRPLGRRRAARATPGSCASPPPPERGRANASVVELLAASLDVRRPDVRIVGGAVSRDKVVEIVGLTLEEAERRLASAQKGTS